MTPAQIYNLYLSCSPNELRDFPYGDFLRDGPCSITIAPPKKNTVIKIIKPGHLPFGLDPQEEFTLLDKLQGLKGKLFVLPKQLSWGTNLDYLEMTKLGKTFGHIKTNPHDVKKAGLAIGEFSGLLFQKHQSVHMDICPNNFTLEPDGKIGIIDIASIKQVNKPEVLFSVPLSYKQNIAPYIALNFEQQTGIALDFDLITKYATSFYTAPSQAIRKTIKSNLAEWRWLKEKGQLNVRPNSKNQSFDNQSLML